MTMESLQACAIGAQLYPWEHLPPPQAHHANGGSAHGQPAAVIWQHSCLRPLLMQCLDRVAANRPSAEEVSVQVAAKGRAKGA